MADAKITQLSEDTGLVLTDLLATVEDPGGTPVTKKATIANVLALAYPVGSIYISTNSTNPGTSLGFGTWSAFGAGRVPVGFSSGETEFDTDEETGGDKTHTLTTNEMPAHVHTIGEVAIQDTGSGTTVTTDSGGTTGETQSTGGGGAHNNLQPYIVIRMWKRTA